MQKVTNSGELSTISPVSSLDIKSAGEVWDRVIRGIIHTLVFLLPVLFTPWTFEPLEFSKQMILFVLTSAALVSWFLKFLVTRTWRFVKTPLDLPIAVLIGVYFLASIFSVDRVASFLGFYGSFSGNFFQVLFLVFLFYLIVNNFSSLPQLQKLLGTFLFSVFLVLLYGTLQFFGLFALRFPFAKIESFNTVGGLLMIALFAAFAVVMSLAVPGKTWFNFFSGKLWRVLAIITGFVVLLAVNFLYSWAALLIGILAYLVFQVGLGKGLAIKNFLTPLILLILVISFVVIQLVFPFIALRNIFNFNLPLEVRLDYTTAMPVLKGVVMERPVLGSGPGTFAYAFSRHRDQNFNNSPFWNVRFDKAPSEAAESLVGTGILGFLAAEILFLTFIMYALFFLFRKREAPSWSLALALFSSYAILWVAHWFFFFNTVTVFSFWFTMAAFLAASQTPEDEEKDKTFSFSLGESPRQTVSVFSGAAIGFVLIVVFLFFAVAVYAADVFFKRGIVASAKEETFPGAEESLRRAVDLNRFRQDYLFSYAEYLLVRINLELSKKDPNAAQIQSWLASSIQRSRQAVELSPNNWAAWERLANLYTSARPLVSGVDRFIIDSLQQAIQKDSKNPILFAELGQVYRIAARQIDPAILGRGVDSDNDGLSDEQEQVLGSDPDEADSNGNKILDGNEVLAGFNPARQSEALPDDFLGKYVKVDQEMLIKAKDAFRKALELKSDYAPAYYQLALSLAQENKIEEALGELEKALQLFPSNITLKFELGALYLNSGKPDLAARQFQEIVAAVPGHANARFSLALSLEQMGRTKRALEEYRIVLETNPDNAFLQQKIKQLEGAK